MSFSPGVLPPDELNLVQRVFQRIAKLEWVSQEPETQRRLAAHVLQVYGRGITDPEQLHATCLVAAKENFARGERQQGEIHGQGDG